MSGTWTEVEIDSERISVTLYAEDEDGVARVKDEMWFTQMELENAEGKYVLE